MINALKKHSEYTSAIPKKQNYLFYLHARLVEIMKEMATDQVFLLTEIKSKEIELV